MFWFLILKISYFETSALNGQGINEAFEQLTRDIMKKKGVGKGQEENGVDLNKTNKRVKQDPSLVTFAPTIKREEEHIDFNKCGKDIINLIRGLNPFPLSNIILNDLECKVLDATFVKENIDKPYKVLCTKNKLGITCNDGIIYLNTIKPFGKKVMNITDYLNGVNNKDINWSVR